MDKLLRKFQGLMLVAALAVAGGGLPAPAIAGLAGNHAEIAVGFAEIDTLSINASATVLVQDPGIEAVAMAGIFNIDMLDGGMRVDVVNLIDSITLPSMTFVGVFARNFEGNTIGTITGGSFNIVGFETPSSDGQNRFIHNSLVLAFNLEGLTLSNGDFIEVTFDVIPTIPEPASYAYMLAGLGVFAIFALRRRV